MVLLKRTLYLSLATLLLLELTMQVGSWIVWLGNRESTPQHAGDGEKTVLCIGDSFTYGMGSSKHEFSYPAQLEVMLREQLDPGWRVVNAGYPGRNSRDLLERIEDQLETYSPQFVYVIIGINDQWTRPELLDLSIAREAGTPALAANSFRWELRTLRLLKWMTGGILTDDTLESPEPSTRTSPQKPRQIPAALVDAWVHPGFSLDIDQGGRVAFSGVDLTSSVTGDTLTLHWPSGESLDLHWQRHGKKLRLRGAGWAKPIELQSENRTPQTLASKAGAAEVKGDFASAADLYELAISVAPQKARAYWYNRLVLCLIKLERSEQAIELIELLRSRYAKHNEASWATALCSSLSAVGNRDECLLATKSALKMFPDNPYLLQIHGWEEFQSGEKEEGIQAMERAVALSADLDLRFRRFIRLRLVTMLQFSHQRRAIEVIAELFSLKDSLRKLTVCIQPTRDLFDLDFVEETLATTELTEPEQEELFDLFTALYAPNDAPFEIVEAHLDQIIELTSRSRAKAVLSSYPWHNQQLSAIHERLERRTSAGRMEMATAFAKVLKTAPRSELFGSDRHCNDRGYRLMAEQVFTDLRKRLAR